MAGRTRRPIALLSGIVAFLAAAGVVFTFASAGALPAARFHAHLEKSEPAANDTLGTSPHALKLWFSEKIELKTSSVKLEGASGPVALGDLVRDDVKENAPVTSVVTKTLAVGRYTVSWTAGGKDGHPAKGTYTFVIKGAK